MNANKKKSHQRQPRTFKVRISYQRPGGQLAIYRSRVHAIGAHQAADLASEWLEIEHPGSVVVQRAAKLVQRTSVRRAQAQPDSLGKALAC